MRSSEQINEIATALAKAQGTMKHAGFDSTNPHFKSKYASLPSVIDAIRPHLSAVGIAWVQSIETSPNALCAVTRLVHTSGQWIEMDGPYIPVDKNNAHGVVSATTYARRVGVSVAVGLGSDDDDDGNAAVAAAPRPVDIAKLNHVAAYVKDALKRDDRGAIAEAFEGLTDEEKSVLWRAETRGGYFSQAEKTAIREAKFSLYKESVA